MDYRFKILMVSSEMTPFAKTGGLGDVVGALPKALRQRGHEICVVLPKYSFIDTQKYGIELFHYPMGVRMGNKEEWCSVHRSFFDGVPVYFIEQNDFFYREGLYHDKEMNDYRDNPKRFAFLCRAALQLCLDRGFSPDIVHANDWQTALLPAYLKTLDWRNTVLERSASVLTIHNLAYQGVYSKTNYPYTGLGWENFIPGIFEYYNAINFLQGGIYYADMVNTVSPTYAREITTPAMGNGLDRNLRAKEDRFRGILNGVDYEVWSPEYDKYLPAHYSIDHPEGKKICKRALQKVFNLNPDTHVALLGVVGRFVEQKGYHLLAEILEELMNTMYIQFVILGTGDKHLENFYRSMAYKYGDRMGAYIGFSEELAHLIEAGSDFFIMPSMYEPCGLNQIYSLRYGTLPIVRATGGLNDSVENYNEYTGEGTGFKFWDFTTYALYYTIGWAVSTYYDRPYHMKNLIRNAMSRRFSWDMSAQEYEYAYLKALT
ncbi:MAG TPA: glycogen synthase GlgA [Candidatus Eremiobacteraeota bacterium]|nr:MAG: Glycogen synthase [bacterium ADurb.Bin363]HPZ06872.1 glycogen synthase GlgA [Candidatus Eremiobacteraeota bacterium]